MYVHIYIKNLPCLFITLSHEPLRLWYKMTDLELVPNH